MLIINVLLGLLLLFCTIMFAVYFKNDIKKQAEIDLLNEQIKELKKKWKE
nr:MAG TPA: cell division protein [Caudoviricetes sp.]